MLLQQLWTKVMTQWAILGGITASVQTLSYVPCENSVTISMQNWGDSVFSNQQLGMRVHIRIVMIMVLK